MPRRPRRIGTATNELGPRRGTVTWTDPRRAQQADARARSVSRQTLLSLGHIERRRSGSTISPGASDQHDRPAARRSCINCGTTRRPHDSCKPCSTVMKRIWQVEKWDRANPKRLNGWPNILWTREAIQALACPAIRGKNFFRSVNYLTLLDRFLIDAA